MAGPEPVPVPSPSVDFFLHPPATHAASASDNRVILVMPRGYITYRSSAFGLAFSRHVVRAPHSVSSFMQTS